MFRIIPLKEDKKVINPPTLKRVPMEGIVVRSITKYWRNRKIDGDVKIEEIKSTKKDKK